MRQAAFLDRDGVLNKPILRDGSVGSPRSLEEFELFEDAVECVTKLHAAGLLVIVVSNQPDVARGSLDPQVLERMHDWLKRATAVDAIYACPHDDVDNCFCRKPKPGLLLRSASEWGIALSASYMVGDSWKDIDAGNSAGCQTFLVGPLRGQTEQMRASYCVSDLRSAVEMITLHRAPQKDFRTNRATLK